MAPAIHGGGGVLADPGRHVSRRAAALMVLALFGGCSGFSASGDPPPPRDPNVYPKDYRTQVAEVLRTTLDNPTRVRDAFISEPALKAVGQRTQYVLCVRYNPRDSQQRYTGNEEKAAIFLGGRINQFLASTREWCAGAAFQRYPEVENMVP